MNLLTVASSNPFARAARTPQAQPARQQAPAFAGTPKAPDVFFRGPRPYGQIDEFFYVDDDTFIRLPF